MSDHPDPSPDRNPSIDPTEPPRAKRKRRPETGRRRRFDAPDLARSGRGWPAEPAGTWTI